MDDPVMTSEALPNRLDLLWYLLQVEIEMGTRRLYIKWNSLESIGVYSKVVKEKKES
jgi:hypothetical protein